MKNSGNPDQVDYTVYKGTACPGSAALGLITVKLEEIVLAFSLSA